MPTLKDVAKRANVSVSTASYSINNNPLIPEETRNRVKQIASEMGYRPNANAKNLKKQKTMIIGLFLSGFSGPFFTDMMEGIQEVVISKGYELVVASSVEEHRLLVERYVDGAIILNYHMKDDFLRRLAGETFPIVVMDRMLAEDHIIPVVLPNERGAEIGTRHLLDKGKTQLLFMAGAADSFDGERRMEGFKKALFEAGLPFRNEWVIRADFTEKSGYETFTTYLNERKELPDGIVAANDEMAMGVIRAITEKGLRVPEDIAVVGFDDIDLAKHVHPSLTTVHVPKKDWGIYAATVLFDLLGKRSITEELPIELTLVVRESS